jgi:hypothetical protein
LLREANNLGLLQAREVTVVTYFDTLLRYPLNTTKALKLLSPALTLPLKQRGVAMGTFALLLLVFLFFYDTSMFKLALGIIVLHAFLGEHDD